MADSQDTETDTELTAAEQRLAGTLASSRAVPSAGFRGALGRHVAATDRGYPPRPGRLRLMVAALISVGVIVLALGVLQATGSI